MGGGFARTCGAGRGRAAAPRQCIPRCKPEVEKLWARETERDAERLSEWMARSAAASGGPGSPAEPLSESVARVTSHSDSESMARVTVTACRAAGD